MLANIPRNPNVRQDDRLELCILFCIPVLTILILDTESCVSPIYLPLAAKIKKVLAETLAEIAHSANFMNKGTVLRL